MKKRSPVQRFRLIVQITVLILVTWVAFAHQIFGGGPGGAPNIHAICPFGGVESLYQYVADHSFIPKLNVSNLVLLVGTIVLGVVFSRYFCGWLCAFGTLQELFEKLGKKLKLPTITVPAGIDKPLRWLKYILLILILVLTWKTGTLIIAPYDPFAAYAHIPAGWSDLVSEYRVGLIVLIVSMVASMVIPRFFCRYACPLGAMLGILHKISPFRLKREKSTCTSCSLCSRNCPVNIPVASVEKVDSAECIACMECVTVCPTKKGTLKPTIFGKPISIWSVAIGGLLIWFGTIAIANVAGIWKDLPASVGEALQGNPENIRGWMTFDQISAELKIPVTALYRESGLTPQDIGSDVPIKEIGGRVISKGKTFDSEEFRDKVVALYAKKSGKPAVQPAASGEPAFEFRGMMSIAEVSSKTGISAEQLIKLTGLPSDCDQSRPIKEIASENGIPMEPIKQKIESAQK